MRVLFVNRMASMVRGGGETFDLEISRHLEKLGCETSFLTGLPLFSGATSPLDRPRSFTIRSPYFGWFPWDKVRGGWRLRMADFRWFETKAAAWAAERAAEFDVIQVCELPTFVAEWKRRGTRPPVVMRLTAPDYYDRVGALAMADAAIASGDTLTKMRGGARPDCFDIPNGVDADLFAPRPSDFRASHGLAPDAFVVLCVARFQAVKNHRMLIEAFARFAAAHPASRLVLAGSGPLENETRLLCQKAGLVDRVLFLGEVPFPELPAAYAASDLVVIPSLYESFCFAALEAMATARPIVATDTNWVPGLIGRDEGGCVVPKSDAGAMAAAIGELAAAPELRKRMGERNRNVVVEQYGWLNSARKLRAVYEGLVSPRRAG